MDFEKTSISTKVTKFLQENLKDKKDKESLQNIITEKALLKNDAINLKLKSRNSVSHYQLEHLLDVCCQNHVPHIFMHPHSYIDS